MMTTLISALIFALGGASPALPTPPTAMPITEDARLDCLIKVINPGTKSQAIIVDGKRYVVLVPRTRADKKVAMKRYVQGRLLHNITPKECTE